MTSVLPRSTVALLLGAVGCAAEPLRFTHRHVEVEQLAEGIYAFARTEPLSLAVNANSLVIVADDGVAVVDAQFTREATLEHLAALRRITSAPIRYLINTHWHDDHLAGNQVYRDSFPDLVVITHENTRTQLIELGRPNRENNVRFGPPYADYLEGLLQQGLGIDSTPATPAEREAVTSALRIIRTYFAEAPGFREVTCDECLTERRTLHLGQHTIDLRWFGRANTAGDLVVHLPESRVVATGDLVVAPVPFGFNSYPAEWPDALDSVIALGAAITVPGHGRVMRDDRYLRLVQETLRAARRAVEEAGEVPVDSLLARVTLGQYRERFTGGEKWGITMFERNFRGPVLRRLHEALIGT